MPIVKPLKKYLTDMHPSYKDAILNKLKIITSMLRNKNDYEYLTKEDAFRILGMCHIRSKLMDEIDKLITANISRSLLYTCVETQELRINNNKMMRLAEELVMACLQQELKQEQFKEI